MDKVHIDVAEFIRSKVVDGKTYGAYYNIMLSLRINQYEIPQKGDITEFKGIAGTWEVTGRNFRYGQHGLEYARIIVRNVDDNYLF